MKKLSLIYLKISLFVLISYLNTPAQSTSLVNWMSFEEAVKKQEEAPKIILINMYTDWCGWCKRMDENTYGNPAIASYINTHFYPVKFNAERKDTIEYKGNTYINDGQGRRPSHQLAQALMGGRMSFPTTVYIDDDFRAYPVPGYMEPDRIESLLVYFAEKINKNCDFTDFDVDYKNTFNTDFSENIDGVVNWIDFDDIAEKMKHEPKKMILFLNSDYANGSKMMINSVFKHPVVSRYLNEEFYSAKINYDTKDTLEILDNVFINEGEQLGYPHQLTITLLQPDIRLPAMIFFDSGSNLIFALRGYYPPKIIERYLSFISLKLYKSESWEDFNEKFISEIE